MSVLSFCQVCRRAVPMGFFVMLLLKENMVTTSVSIPYGRASFLLTFEQPIHWRTLPTFVSRSLLGAQLKRMCCVQRQLCCESCSIAPSCAYAVLFETPIPKDTDVLPGRNRAAHPFVLTHKQVVDSGRQYLFEVTLIGFTLQYFPFVVLALQRAGEQGIFSDAIHFSLSTIRDEISGQVMTLPLLNSLSVRQFGFTTRNNQVADRANVEFLSPVRIKDRGKYTLGFDAFSLLQALNRRISVLSFLYTETPMPSMEYVPPKDLEITARKLFWKDFSRFSQRQKAAMELGGAVGQIEITGRISEVEKSLLDAGAIFHVGKNTGFGLGHMIVTWPADDSLNQNKLEVLNANRG